MGNFLTGLGTVGVGNLAGNLLTRGDGDRLPDDHAQGFGGCCLDCYSFIGRGNQGGHRARPMPRDKSNYSSGGAYPSTRVKDGGGGGFW